MSCWLEFEENVNDIKCIAAINRSKFFNIKKSGIPHPLYLLHLLIQCLVSLETQSPH